MFVQDLLAPTHLLLLLAVVLVVLGPRRLPEAGRSLGRCVREFRHSLGGSSGDDRGESPSAPGDADAAERPRPPR